MNRIFNFAIATIAILSLLATAYSCTTPKAITKTDLTGYWTLKTLRGEAASDAFEGSTPTIEFDFEKLQVAGSAGCNRYFGGFTFEESTFKAPALASTRMMCIEANKEGEFISTLGHKEGLAVSVENGILTFKEGKTIVLEFAKGESLAKATEAVPVDNNSLVGTWTLSKIKGDDASILFGENPATFTYADGGAVNGNAGCNNYRGNATLEGNTINFGPMASTKMACPTLEGEQIFLSILSQPIEASIKEGKLQFSQKGNLTLEFVKGQE